jgi:hypothetical protein
VRTFEVGEIAVFPALTVATAIDQIPYGLSFEEDLIVEGHDTLAVHRLFEK